MDEPNNGLNDMQFECLGLTIIDDDIVEPEETVSFNLIVQDPQNQVIVSSNASSATLTIEDNDGR